MRSRLAAQVLTLSLSLALAVALAWTGLDPPLASADKDHDRGDYGKRDGHGRKEGKRSKYNCLGRVDNLVYKEQCGGCHFVYQPALLPRGSWQKIMARLEDHFGTDVELDEADRTAIADYLAANAAEKSSSRLAGKILKSLGGRTPLRITEIPIFRHKHEDDDIPAGAFKRKSIGSMSNCIACHTTADQGVYNEDFVRIPD